MGKHTGKASPAKLTKQRPIRNNARKRHEESDDVAKELYAALPRLWRENHADKDEEVARITMPALQKWLRRQKGFVSSPTSLSSCIKTIQRWPSLCLRMGFRFKDPSENGTWSVENLQGFSARHGRVPQKSGKVSWHSSVASFSIKNTGSIEIIRKIEKQTVSCHVEKRRHGDRPLASEMITLTAKSRCNLAVDARRKIKVVRRTVDLLPAVIFTPARGTPPQYTIIHLHALNETAFGNYADKPHYFYDVDRAAIKVIAPTAPSRELSCFDKWWVKSKKPDGRPSWNLMKFISWYDYTSNHDGQKEDSIDWQSLFAIRQAIHGIIEKEAARLGGRYDHIILSGKSQGCCTALDSFLTYPKPLGGFIGLVGHLLDCTPVEAAGPQASVPMYFFHEVEDTTVRWRWAQKGEQTLREAGYKVHARHAQDPQKCGHFIGGVEGAFIRSSLRSICAAST